MKTEGQVWDDSDKWWICFLDESTQKLKHQRNMTKRTDFLLNCNTRSIPNTCSLNACSYHNIISKKNNSLNANILRSIPASSDMNCPCAALRAKATYRSTGSPWSLAMARTVFKFLIKQNYLSYIKFNNLII